MENNSTLPTEITSRDWWALGTYAAVAALLASPLRHYLGPIDQVNEQKNLQDSFPLSTYPMFSAYRRGRLTVPHVIGYTSEGDRVNLHYSHFGKGGLNQTRRQISKLIRAGRATEVAQTYADALQRKPKNKKEKKVIKVEVVRSRFLFDNYFNGDKLPQSESVHASCEVGGIAVKERGKGLPGYDE